MTFVFWWPVLYGLVLLGVLVLWVKTDNRKQRPEVGKTRSLLSVLWSLPVLTDHQCDVVIETVYPKARTAEAIRAVREAVNRGDFGRSEFSRRPVYTGPVDAFSERARHYEDLDPAAPERQRGETGNGK